MENKANKERVFSVELKSKNSIKNVSLANGTSDSVLFEGTIGKLVEAKFAEGIILQVIGENGVVRLDLGEGDIKKTFEQKQLEVKKE